VIHVTLENAPLLLEAATYLSVESIISACCRLLYQNLDLESVVETLVVSDRYQCTSLRDDSVRKPIFTFIDSSNVMVATLRYSLLTHRHLDPIKSADAVSIGTLCPSDAVLLGNDYSAAARISFERDN